MLCGLPALSGGPQPSLPARSRCAPSISMRPACGETGVSADFGPETSRRVESGALDGPAARGPRARARRKAGRSGRP